MRHTEKQKQSADPAAKLVGHPPPDVDDGTTACGVADEDKPLHPAEATQETTHGKTEDPVRLQWFRNAMDNFNRFFPLPDWMKNVVPTQVGQVSAAPSDGHCGHAQWERPRRTNVFFFLKRLRGLA